MSDKKRLHITLSHLTNQKLQKMCEIAKVNQVEAIRIAIEAYYYRYIKDDFSVGDIK